MTTTEPVWRAELYCHVRSLDYDFKTKTGTLMLPPNNCCDMCGCTNMFTRIDSEVRVIRTYAGDELDVTYEREHAGEWTVRLPDGAVMTP